MRCSLARPTGIRRILSRISVADSLPVVAAIFAILVAAGFSVFYAIVTDMRASEQSDLMAERLADSLYLPVSAGNNRQADRLVEQVALNGAVVLAPDGEVLAGQSTPDLIEDGRRYDIASGDKVAGELVMMRALPWKLPLPLTMVAAIVLLIAGMAFILCRIFAQQVGKQVRIMAGLVRNASLEESDEDYGQPPVFSEFRRLRAVTLRRLRTLKRENERLLNAAYTDERTGLGNSADLTRQLTRFISRSSFHTPSAFIQIDIESRQPVGAEPDAASDLEMHSLIAKRISRFVADQQETFGMAKGCWPVFTLPSDGFGVLIDGLGGRTDIMKFVRALIGHLRKPYSITGKSINSTVYAGIALIPEDGQTPQDIRKRASSALIQARRKDDGDLQFYSPKFDRQSAARRRLEGEVRAAVEQKAFLPVFQPKVDLATGRIVGAEALARWKLESGRIVSPGVFIPVAESCGLICDIGEQVTRQACEGAVKWTQMGFNDISIAVNVSPLQFESDDLGNMLINAMADAGLPPRLLQLEITESVAITDPDRLLNVIGPLKSMGVRLAVDDFGTGHSNLATLGRLPFDVFKIDRQFICNLETDKHAPAIVEMILGMAETLGMETVAEGIETKEQRQFLRRRGCHQYQGYYFSPPVPLDKFIQLVRENRQTVAA